MSTTTSFRLRPGEFSVKSYGATGDGTTDDTTFIQAAIDACVAAGGGDVYFPPGIYFVNGAFGGANSENAQLRLPAVLFTDPQITVRLIGCGNPQFIWGYNISALGQPTHGTIIKTTKTGSGNLFGIAKASGNSYDYSGCTVIVESLSIVTYDNPNVTVFDMRQAANFIIRDTTIVPANFSYSGSPTTPTHTGQYGVRFPSTNNAAICLATNLQIMGQYNGIEIGECFEGVGQVFIYGCLVGVVLTPMNHGASFTNLQTTKCPVSMKAPGSGKARVHILSWRYEYITSGAFTETYTLDDASNRVYGTANICPVQANVGEDTHTVKNGGSNFTLTAVG